MFIETTIALIFIFSVLVVVHEFGHFLVAKLSGIRVEEFALGFGPTILKLFKKGDTEYTIHLFPLGGFVKLTGMEPGEENIPDGFQAQAIWKRALTIFAGPFFSFLLAVVVFVGIGLHWGFPESNDRMNQVGMVYPKSEAARMGLLAGDRIIGINNIPIAEGQDLTSIIHDNPGKQVVLKVQRNGNLLTLTGTPNWNILFAGGSWMFVRGKTPVLQSLTKDSAFDKAGITEEADLVSINGKKVLTAKDMLAFIEKNVNAEVEFKLAVNGKDKSIKAKPDLAWISFLGFKWYYPEGYAIKDSKTVSKLGIKDLDLLKKINGKKIKSANEFEAAIKSSSPGIIELDIIRNDQAKTLKINVRKSDVVSTTSSYYEAIGLLGFAPTPRLVKTGFVKSVSRGLSETWMRVGDLIGALTTSRIKKEVGGPVMIAKMTASSVALGPYWVFNMLGGLSMSLAIINLIPIPVLDGGHLLILGVEAIRRKRLTIQEMQVVMMVGLVIIGLLIVTVLWSDIFKWTQGLIPQ